MTPSGQRTARLLGNRGISEGGALPLSEVFSEILTVMYSNGPQSEDVLRKLAHVKIGYKHDRVIADWGTWENFYRDILGVLEDEGYIRTGPEGSWEVTPKVRLYPHRLTIVREKVTDRRVRAIVHPVRLKRARDELDAVSTKLNDIILRLTQDLDLDSEFPNDPFTHALHRIEGADRGLRRALQGEIIDDEEDAEDSLSGEASEGTQLVNSGGRKIRKMGVVSEFTEEYLRSLKGEAVTTAHIVQAFHERYPLQPGDSKVSIGTIAQKLQKMRGDGTAEKVETGKPFATKHGPRIYWRYTGE